MLRWSQLTSLWFVVLAEVPCTLCVQLVSSLNGQLRMLCIAYCSGQVLLAVHQYSTVTVALATPGSSHSCIFADACLLQSVHITSNQLEPTSW